MTDDGLLSVDEAAEKSGYSRETLFGWMRQGALTPKKRQGDQRTMIDRDELLAAVVKAKRRPYQRQRPRGEV